MNLFKKIITLFVVMGMLFAVCNTTSADTTGSITINPPEGITGTNTYTIYKVFDAEGDGTNISYKLVSGKSTAPTGFSVDEGGNVSYTGSGTSNQLTSDDIASIADYIKNDTPVATATSTGSAAAVASNLPNGYYYITTSTGTLVTINSTNPNVTVNDKNTIPTIDKTITGASDITDNGKKALAQIGTDVEYTAVVTVGKGSKNLVFHDAMGTGLTFKGNSNVTVTSNPTISGTSWFTIKTTPDSGDTLTITFADGIAENTQITIKYLATINAQALNKLENDAYVSYGDNHSTTHSKTETYNAEIGLVKYDGKNTDSTNDDTELSGAKFILAKDVTESGSSTVTRKYYKIDGTVVSWVNNESDATIRTTDSDGVLEAKFIGLANGTYILIEKEAPKGFNKASDTNIVIASGNYTLDNLSQTSTVINNKGNVLPTTGGIGTTVFHVAGAALAIGAAVLLISKKRMNNN